MKDHQVLESKWLPLIGPSYKVNMDGAVFEIKNELVWELSLEIMKETLLLGSVSSWCN